MRPHLLAALFLLAGLLPLAATGVEAGMLKMESPHDVTTTLDRLEEVLKAKGIDIFIRIDHAAAAKQAGMELWPVEVLLFGNPKLGTPLMKINPEAGFDLPMRALAWQNKEGKVWLGVTNPRDLNQTYALAGGNGTIEKMEAALKTITTEALKK